MDKDYVSVTEIAGDEVTQEQVDRVATVIIGQGSIVWARMWLRQHVGQDKV